MYGVAERLVLYHEVPYLDLRVAEGALAYHLLAYPEAYLSSAFHPSAFHPLAFHPEAYPEGAYRHPAAYHPEAYHPEVVLHPEVRQVVVEAYDIQSEYHHSTLHQPNRL